MFCFLQVCKRNRVELLACVWKFQITETARKQIQIWTFDVNLPITHTHKTKDERCLLQCEHKNMRKLACHTKTYTELARSDNARTLNCANLHGPDLVHEDLRGIDMRMN